MDRKPTFYEKYIKRILDIICAVLVMVLFCWLYGILAILVRVKLGSPVIFSQPRPGKVDKRTGQEKIFTLYKFRSMTDQRDKNGQLLPDDVRLTRFGKWLRSTSLDELPEMVNILKGDMSLVGPRPQLVKDMVFMSSEQRKRHLVRQGLTGWAQINGRNSITWEEKLNYDLEYVDDISFSLDIRIVFLTIGAVFKHEGITDGNMETAQDLGDYLLGKMIVSMEEYKEKQNEAEKILMRGKANE